MHNRKFETFIGYLTPIKWNQEGKVVKYSIYTDAEEDIPVDSYKLFSELHKLKNRKVTARGKIIKTSDGNPYLLLNEIRPFKRSDRLLKFQTKDFEDGPIDFISLNNNELEKYVQNYSPISYWEAS